MLLLLLSCWIITGAEAEDNPVMHYGLINSSVCLQVKETPPTNSSEWKLDKKVIVLYSNLNPEFKEKVVFSPGNFSLCIKNLTESDAGRYEFSFHSGFNLVSETHQVIVQDVVPLPEMWVHRSNLSAGFCRITANCSVLEDWATFVCDKDDCTSSQTPIRTVNITIFTERDTVVCRGNNHVSTKNVSRNIAACFPEHEDEHQDESQAIPITTKALIVTVVCVAVCVGLCVIILCRNFPPCQKSQVSAAQVIQSQPGETPSPAEPRASTSSSCLAGPSYENVDPAELGRTGSPGEQQPADSLESPTVDSIYSFPNVTVTAATSQPATPACVAQDEKPQATDVNSVYCLLQMPKR